VNQQNLAAADLVLPSKVLAERTVSGHQPWQARAGRRRPGSP